MTDSMRDLQKMLREIDETDLVCELLVDMILKEAKKQSNAEKRHEEKQKQNSKEAQSTDTYLKGLCGAIILTVDPMTQKQFALKTKLIEVMKDYYTYRDMAEGYMKHFADADDTVDSLEEEIAKRC